MSEYYNEKPRRNGNGWFYVVLIIIAMVIGGLFVKYMLPALEKPGENMQVTLSPTPTPEITTPAATTAVTQSAEPDQTDYSNDGAKFESNINLAEDATAADMLEAVSPAVVGISNRVITTSGSNYYYFSATQNDGAQDPQGEETEQAYGSGVIVSTDGYVITNHHVIEDADSIYVVLNDGEEVKANVVGSDAMSDLALLKIDYQGLTAVSLGDSDQLRVGNTVYAIGNPTGAKLYGTITCGIVSALNRQITIDQYLMTYIQTDAAINSGNSGGALINSQGQLVGICSAKTMSSGYDSYGRSISTEGLGYAIPINNAMAIINELKEHGYISRPVLGVKGGFLTSQGAAYYNCPIGFVVNGLTAGGGAEAAGIQEGDLIIALDGQSLTSYAEMSSYLAKCKVGDVVSVRVWRSGETTDINVTLSASNNE